MNPYRDNFDYLKDNFNRLGLLVERELVLCQHRFSQNKNPNPNLVVTESDIINNHTGTSLPQEVRLTVDTITQQLDDISLFVKNRLSETQSAGISLPFLDLFKELELNDIEIDILLLCALPEFDRVFERIFAYIQDDITKKLPTVDLFMNRLLVRENDHPCFQLLLPRNKLRRFGLVEPITSPPFDSLTFLGTQFRLTPRMAEYLFDVDGISLQLQHILTFAKPDVSLNDDAVSSLGEQISITKNRDSSDRGALLVYLDGSDIAAKIHLASSYCRSKSKACLVVSSSAMVHEFTSNDPEIVLAVFREAFLCSGLLFFDRFDILLSVENQLLFDRVLSFIDMLSSTVFVSGTKEWELGASLPNTTFLRHTPSGLLAADRHILIERYLDKYCLSMDDNDIADIASSHSLDRGQLHDAVVTARSISRRHLMKNGKLPTANLRAACEYHSKADFGSLATRIDPRYTWDDIVLSKETLAQLKDITSAVRYRDKVYGDWGFENRFFTGNGVYALFSGSSGTGKTMAAEVIARDLGVSLFAIDLSCVVSKYIGETEKNLAKIFAEAAQCNAILFFDEADALFGKRTEVKDAHDRYANLEVSYLLQRMEQYQGLSILATNLRQNIDDAFVRRIRFIVDFKMPDESLRLAIWKGMFPSSAPLSQDIDWEFLAKKISMAGGDIKNMVLSASFYAAETNSDINMSHIARAVKREYNKKGTSYLLKDMSPYIG